MTLGGSEWSTVRSGVMGDGSDGLEWVLIRMKLPGQVVSGPGTDAVDPGVSPGRPWSDLGGFDCSRVGFE